MTLTGHGFKSGHPILFTTTGALPTGIVASDTYYIKVIDANTFNLSTEIDLTELVNTTSAGSGTHSAFAGDSLVQANEYRNFQIRIVQDLVNPTAVGQRRVIASHTA